MASQELSKTEDKDTLRIVIRADASLDIGSGHIMRCLAMAEKLRRKGGQISFICREHSGHVADYVKSKGFDVFLMPKQSFRLKTQKTNSIYVDGKPPHAHWLRTSWRKDAEDTIDVLKREKPCLLVVDHFGIDAAWERTIKRAFPIKIAVIDGQQDRSHDCDILIDPNYSADGSERWNELVPPQCQLFIGPQYTFLRPEFINARRTLKKRDGIIRRIFISFGGVDNSNATGMAVEAVKKIVRSDIMVDVIVGDGNNKKKELLKKCEELPNFTCHFRSNNIAKLMADADLSIGAGGTMMWERCYLGLPTILLSIAFNQEKNCQALSQKNAVIYLGTLARNDIESVKEAICMAIDSPHLMRRISQRSLTVMGTDDASAIDTLCNALLG